MAYQLRDSDEDILICEGARVAGDVTLGKGVSVWYNAVLRGDEGAITVGENTNIQDGAVLHEETKVAPAAPSATTPLSMAAPWETMFSSVWAPWFSTAPESEITALLAPERWLPARWTPRLVP